MSTPGFVTLKVKARVIKAKVKDEDQRGVIGLGIVVAAGTIRGARAHDAISKIGVESSSVPGRAVEWATMTGVVEAPGRINLAPHESGLVRILGTSLTNQSERQPSFSAFSRSITTHCSPTVTEQFCTFHLLIGQSSNLLYVSLGSQIQDSG